MKAGKWNHIKGVVDWFYIFLFHPFWHRTEWIVIYNVMMRCKSRLILFNQNTSGDKTQKTRAGSKTRTQLQNKCNNKNSCYATKGWTRRRETNQGRTQNRCAQTQEVTSTAVEGVNKCTYISFVCKYEWCVSGWWKHNIQVPKLYFVSFVLM